MGQLPVFDGVYGLEGLSYRFVLSSEGLFVSFAFCFGEGGWDRQTALPPLLVSLLMAIWMVAGSPASPMEAGRGA